MNREAKQDESRPSAALEILLLPFSVLFGSLARARDWAYATGALRSYRAQHPDRKPPIIVSVGNLTTGGTGKTPVTAFLVERFRERGYKVGLISRGYGRSGQECSRVKSDGSRSSALLFGDEPTWLAKRFPDVPVFVCADRVKAALQLMSETEVDLILADDAFQHRRLKRAFDIVILDATEPAWHYRPLPLGRMREGFKALDRAQAVILTKTNLAHRAHVEYLKEHVEKAKQENPALLSFEFESKISGFAPLPSVPSQKEQSSDPLLSQLKNLRLLLISGIGRPATFRALVEQSTVACEIADHMIFSDHHVFTKEDLYRVQERAREMRAQAIVMTEKDATKFSAWETEFPCWVSRLEMGPVRPSVTAGGSDRSKQSHGFDEMEAFYEAVGRSVL